MCLAWPRSGRRLTRIFQKYRTRMGGTGPRPVPSGDAPDGTGTTPCGNECLPTVGAPSSSRPASGRAARAGRPCHPDKCEISGLGDGQLDAALDDARADGVARESRSVVHVELLHEMLTMFLDGLDADTELGRRLLIGLS